MKTESETKDILRKATLELLKAVELVFEKSIDENSNQYDVMLQREEINLLRRWLEATDREAFFKELADELYDLNNPCGDGLSYLQYLTKKEAILNFKETIEESI